MKVPKILILILGFLFVFAENGYSGSLEELESLPYLAWSDKPDTRPSGVVKYNKSKAFDGYNLYTDEWKNVYLMDMAGQVAYHWKLHSMKGTLQYVRLLDDGSIVAVSAGLGFVKIDKNSRLVWATPILVHHDIEVLADGTFLVPAVELPVRYNDRCVSFDSIVHLSKEGKILDKWSTYTHLKDLQKLHFPSLLDKKPLQETADNFKNIDNLRINLHMPHMIFGGDQCAVRSYKEWFDYYHLNSIQVLPDTSLGLKDKRFQKGNWLIGFRNVDLICILDKDTYQVVWSWGAGILDGPHSPRMLNNSNILVFDNGYHRSYSRLIMVDPGSDKIVWEFKTKPPESFYSMKAGSSQHLSNGNFLICEGMNGHVFEITPGGDIVWEFFNPEKKKDGRRKTIYRMTRISKREVSGWLRGV